MGKAKSAAPQLPAAGPIEEANSVLLRGRVPGIAEPRDLPSGDQLRMIRVVVPRASTRGRPAGIDTIDVACWSARTRRTAGLLAVGDGVAVSGALRRRFFRTPTGPASRYEVEAASLRRIAAP